MQQRALAIFNSCYVGARIFERRLPSSIASSPIVSLYRQIVSRASCSFPRLSTTIGPPLRYVLNSNSYEREWIGRGALYALNIADLSSQTQFNPETPDESDTPSATKDKICDADGPRPGDEKPGSQRSFPDAAHSHAPI